MHALPRTHLGSLRYPVRIPLLCLCVDLHLLDLHPLALSSLTCASVAASRAERGDAVRFKRMLNQCIVARRPGMRDHGSTSATFAMRLRPC